MYPVRIVAALLAALAAAGPIQAAPRISGTMGEAIAVPAAVSASLQAALNRINELRSQAGAAPLAFNEQLRVAAKAHAVDMADNGYFSHTSRDGRTPGQRIAATGYSYGTYGETIAWGYRDWNAAITGWMGSPGHRAILLSTRYREVGLGKREGYYVADFATSRD